MPGDYGGGRPPADDQPHGPGAEGAAVPGEAGRWTCVRCGREVRVSRDSFEIFERMHYVCFHYEFEHTGFDPDEECDAGGCPSSLFKVPGPPLRQGTVG